MRRFARRRAFTLIELLVLLGIVGILVSIFVPYVLAQRESGRRARCADNLRKISLALGMYAQKNGGAYPRVRYEPERLAAGYVAYSGADAASAFGPGSAVSPSDVTASLWLLVRDELIGSKDRPGAADFVCPSSGGRPDPLRNAAGAPVRAAERGNFRRGQHLSYSYCSPFSPGARFRLTDSQAAGFAVMADRSPGTKGKRNDVTRPARGASALEMAWANSNNHEQAGQNVLYVDGHVAWEVTPYCGVSGDNVYTALASEPVGDKPVKADDRGVSGPQYSPAHAADSYLVPTDDEMEAGAFPPVPAASQPSTGPAGGVGVE